jgi:hypothetical protein
MSLSSFPDSPKLTLTFNFQFQQSIEYDDYYGAFEDEDEEFDLDDDDFAAKYLSSGIDLKLSESNNIREQQKQQQQQLPFTPDDDILACGSQLDELKNETSTATSLSSNIKSLLIANTNRETNSTILSCTSKEVANSSTSTKRSLQIERDGESLKQTETVSSDLTKLAIQHLDKHQWQLPLMEMDQKFRDRTYYKHYSDSYISSTRSKLGNFLADNQLLSNPMRYHAQLEQDNYDRYSKMFKLLTNYYQTLGSNFFSFATPSPDEEIVIGCRLGTKGCYLRSLQDSLFIELFVRLSWLCCCSS